MNKLRLGVAGLNRGERHVWAAKIAPHIEVTAVADLDFALAESVAKRYDVPKAYESLSDMLYDKDIDAVVLATPIPDHAEHVIATLAAGKHALSEVTCATRMNDLYRIAAAARASDKLYMLAENYVYIRAWTIVREMARQGLFGEIYYAESDYVMDFQQRPGFPNLNSWRQDVYFGRKGHPYITHSLGPVAHLLGERIETVSCLGAGSSYDFPADDMCVLTMRTQGGKLIRLRNTFVTARPDLYTSYGLQGTKGAYQSPQSPRDFHKVHIRGQGGANEWRNLFDFKEYLPKEWAMYENAGVRFDDTRDDGRENYDSGCTLMLDAFAKAALEGGKPEISPEEALNWTAAGLLSDESARLKGQPVTIPKFE